MPEMVRPEWGTLVPPRDAVALAAAIGDLLALPVEARAAMGRRGREHAVSRFSVRGEAQKLLGIIERDA
jgi:glycosyltransferase involved in cell wall biosynthesis